jgi:hypothetical protein
VRGRENKTSAHSLDLSVAQDKYFVHRGGEFLNLTKGIVVLTTNFGMEKEK